MFPYEVPEHRADIYLKLFTKCERYVMWELIAKHYNLSERTKEQEYIRITSL
jgi:hypothetical protein